MEHLANWKKLRKIFNTQMILQTDIIYYLKDIQNNKILKALTKKINETIEIIQKKKNYKIIYSKTKIINKKNYLYFVYFFQLFPTVQTLSPNQ